jgi:hypothetical protein
LCFIKWVNFRGIVFADADAGWKKARSVGMVMKKKKKAPSMHIVYLFTFFFFKKKKKK